MWQKHILIVRDKIALGRPCTDEDLKHLDCYYESNEFLWDKTLTSLDTIIDSLQEHFSHFLDWTAEVVAVEQ